MREGESVHGAAAEASRMLDAGESLDAVWRFVIVQLLDDYSARLRHADVAAAASLFTEEPAPTGDVRVDAALAALAEHLARRDGWRVPRWVAGQSRYTPRWWFVTGLRGLHPRALRESPLSFRERGVFITSGALSRV